MKKNIFDQNNLELEFSNLIEACPSCHCVIDPRVVNIYNADEITKLNHINEIEMYIVTFYCKKCRTFFHAIFSRPFGGFSEWFIENVYPKKVQGSEFSSIIKTLSPTFVSCYNQSEQAEAENLDEISGIGYRRALEYLMKDFVSSLYPDKEFDIKSDTKLSNIISNRLPNTPEFMDIKEMAASSWALGCDFVHYDKQYINYDLNDLKQCIDLTVTSIEFFLKKSKYCKKNLKKTIT